MKIKVMLSYIMSVFAFAVAAQGVENDDMYFNSKDRAALRAAKGSELSYTADAKKPARKNSENKAEEENVNPTDSYSARTVNPEFAARSNAQSAQADNEDYFVNDYKYTTTSNFSNWNNNYNRWYNNPWYTSAYFGPNINSWNSPYYGYSDPYYSPWYDPYWNNSGWSASFSYHYGSSWNYGWGGNYNYWNRPYCGWASSWGPSYGFGYGYGWGSSWYGYPRTIVIVDRSENYAPNYGKRPSRSSYVAGSNIEPSNREATRRANSNSVREQSSGGRVATQNGAREYTTSPSRSAQTEQYYDRSWRRTQQSSTPSSSSPSYSAPQRSATYDRPSNYGNSSNSSYSAPQRSNNRDNSSFSSPSRSSSPSYNSGSSGGSRSGGSSTSGSRRGRD
jgi:hypothetical protein